MVVDEGAQDAGSEQRRVAGELGLCEGCGVPGESQGRGSLVGCRLWGRTESDTTDRTQQQHLWAVRINQYSSFLPRRWIQSKEECRGQVAVLTFSSVESLLSLLT